MGLQGADTSVVGFSYIIATTHVRIWSIEFGANIHHGGGSVGIPSPRDDPRSPTAIRTTAPPAPMVTAPKIIPLHCPRVPSFTFSSTYHNGNVFCGWRDECRAKGTTAGRGKFLLFALTVSGTMSGFRAESSLRTPPLERRSSVFRVDTHRES